ncbi:MAG: right-handed parallel beta-helix repeat-containing protein, partial [Flavobacteriales bacterium]
MRKHLSLLLMLVPFAAAAATYYVSPTGSDTNNGTSQSTPWRTIGRVNQATLVAGDKVLFQRGGVYRGKLNIMQSGNANAYIEIGAYGSTGERPVISGSVAVTGWTIHSGSIWKAPLAQVPRHLYINGQMQQIARYPNTGFLYMDGGTSTSTTDSDLNQPAGFWNGATAVIRPA